MTVVSGQWSRFSKGVFCFALCAMLLGLRESAWAQTVKVPRIGWLTGGLLSSNSSRQEAFRQGNPKAKGRKAEEFMDTSFMDELESTGFIKSVWA
jgi:hypothetical protein